LFLVIIKVIKRRVGIMLQKQQTMILSPYTEIYDLVVPKDNFLRRLNELIDFSFVYDELNDKYCHTNGRNAIDPIRMFKYLDRKSTRLNSSHVSISYTVFCLKSKC